MCGRYAIQTEEDNEEIRKIIEDVLKSYRDRGQYPVFKTGEIFPTDTVPIIVNQNKQKTIELFKWGFLNPVKTGAVHQCQK